MHACFACCLLAACCQHVAWLAVIFRALHAGRCWPGGKRQAHLCVQLSAVCVRGVATSEAPLAGCPLREEPRTTWMVRRA
eukprot:scaffold49905_cov343-Isochrysis_galbana.AAC.1